MATYITVDTEEKLADLARQMSACKTICLDLETTGLNRRKDTIVGWAIATREQEAFYIPVDHSIGDQLPSLTVIDKLKTILESCPTVVFHNAKFDTGFLLRVGVDIPEEAIEDTLLEVFSAGLGHDNFEFDVLVEKIFKHRTIKFDDLFPRGTKNKNIGNILIDIITEYAGEDADYTLRLHNKFFESVRTSFIYKMEKQLWPVVRRIEDHGAMIDPVWIDVSARYLEAEAEKVLGIIHDQIEAATGQRVEFNIASGDQLASVIFGMMQIPSTVKTPTGKQATSKIALERLATQYPVIANILTYRSMNSNAVTLRSLQTKHVDPDTGRIHTQYKQHGATSGRFASVAPNVQNISKIKEWVVYRVDGSTYEVSVSTRGAFIAPEGKYIIELDFAAIEYVIFAALAGAQDVVDSYLRGEDVHKKTASDIFKVPLGKVTPDQRRRGKTYNYLILYGGGAQGLSQRTGTSEEEAAAEIRAFYMARPKLQVYSRRVKDRARKTKTVHTFFGRRQVVPEYFQSGRRAASKAERASVNRIIQGTAADYHKMGLIRADTRMRKLYTDDQAMMILQTHDSQTWEVDMSIPPSEIVPLLTDAMAADVSGLPRIRVDAQIGCSWYPLADWDESIDFESTIGTMRRVRAERIEQLTSAASDAPTEPTAEQLSMGLSEMSQELPTTSNPVQRLRLEPHEILTRDKAAQLKSILTGFPGSNVVYLILDGQTPKPLSNLPTSLTVDGLRDVLSPIFPNAIITIDREALVSAVLAGVDLSASHDAEGDQSN